MNALGWCSPQIELFCVSQSTDPQSLDHALRIMPESQKLKRRSAQYDCRVTISYAELHLPGIGTSQGNRLHATEHRIVSFPFVSKSNLWATMVGVRKFRSVAKIFVFGRISYAAGFDSHSCANSFSEIALHVLSQYNEFMRRFLFPLASIIRLLIFARPE